MENVQDCAVVVAVVTKQLALVTAGAVPPQAVKLKPDAGLAVSVTVVPLT